MLAYTLFNNLISYTTYLKKSRLAEAFEFWMFGFARGS